MMIRRYEINPKHALLAEGGFQRALKGVRRLLVKMQEDFKIGYYGAHSPLSDIIYNRVYEEKKDFFYWALRGHTELNLAALLSVFSRKYPVNVNLINGEYCVKSRGKNRSELNFEHWNYVFDFAVLLGDKEMLNKLLQLDIWYSDIQDKYDRVRAYYYKYLHEENAQGRQEILREAEEITYSTQGIMNTASGPVEIESTSRSDYFREYLLPVLHLYEFILMKEYGKFNRLLERCIIKRKERAKERKEEQSSTLWADYELLACCAYANERGIEITVQSEYIPEWIYRRDYPKQIPVFKEKPKSQEELDFEKFDKKFVHYQGQEIPLPPHWEYEYDKGRFRAGEGDKIRLTLTCYPADKEKHGDSKNALQQFGEAYAENDFPFSSEIKGAGSFLYRLHAFEGENIMMIAGREMQFLNKNHYYFYVFRAESNVVLQEYLKRIYFMIRFTRSANEINVSTEVEYWVKVES